MLARASRTELAEENPSPSVTTYPPSEPSVVQVKANPAQQQSTGDQDNNSHEHQGYTKEDHKDVRTLNVSLIIFPWWIW